ncbi:glycine cleavage system H protein [Fontimonas thermophila]|uniref:Glycine cleavage system H protein n=1 Tax=Fontimonas thermophila TaxID=1076937 RepID=A0A1I2I673_9GAMM|nr:glycine cleavage system protein GcvH [Fontimonas thermophila]SFF37792.1 glycine cleavage system H protein [Fontimonas thermophila]
MSKVPAELKYVKSHEWVRREADGTVTIGITDHAQAALGDLVFVEVPAVGRRVAAHEACAVVESVKAASDVYAPLSGEIIAVNEALSTNPELLNRDPYGAGWMWKQRPADPADFDALLDAAGYQAYLKTL